MFFYFKLSWYYVKFILYLFLKKKSFLTKSGSRPTHTNASRWRNTTILIATNEHFIISSDLNKVISNETNCTFFFTVYYVYSVLLLFASTEQLLSRKTRRVAHVQLIYLLKLRLFCEEQKVTRAMSNMHPIPLSATGVLSIKDVEI